MRAIKTFGRRALEFLFDRLAAPYIVKTWESARINQVNRQGVIIPCPYCGSVESTFITRWEIDLADFPGLFDTDPRRLRIVYGLNVRPLLPARLYQLYREKALAAVLKRSYVDYRRCTACDLVFQNFPHTAESLAFYYRVLYRSRYQHRDAQTGLEMFGRDDNRWIGKEEQIGSYFLQATGLTGPVKILDVGCAEGQSCKYLESRGVAAFGIEPSQPMVNYARHVLGLQNVTCGTYAPDSYPEAFFDGIFSHHVIEHVLDVRSFIGTMAKHLKPGGYLLIHTPCVDNAKTPDQYSLILLGGHLYGYSEKFLRAALESQSFTILDCRKTPCDLSELKAEDLIPDLGISAWGDVPCGISILARKAGYG